MIEDVRNQYLDNYLLTIILVQKVHLQRNLVWYNKNIPRDLIFDKRKLMIEFLKKLLD